MSALLGSVEDHVTPSNNNCNNNMSSILRYANSCKLHKSDEFLGVAGTVYGGAVNKSYAILHAHNNNRIIKST